MRFRRKYILLAFASFAALAVGGVAYADHGPGGNTGTKCTATSPPGGCQDNVSSLPTWNVAPSALPGSGNGGTNGGSGTLANVGLTIQTHTNYAHPGEGVQGGKAANVALWFDNDIAVNLSGIPTCTATFGGGTTLAAAWERCGPGADDGAGPEVNAYLSPPGPSPQTQGKVSGTISTAPPANFAGCNLVFKKSATTLLLFARATFASTANCSNPAVNQSGTTSTTLTGTLSTQAVTADYKTKLNVPVISPLALDDFKSNVKRGSVFRGRCRDTNKRLNLRAKFTYEDSQQEQPPDTVNKFKACT
jgi:hypothetical protein